MGDLDSEPTCACGHGLGHHGRPQPSPCEGEHPCRCLAFATSTRSGEHRHNGSQTGWGATRQLWCVTHDAWERAEQTPEKNMEWAEIIQANPLRATLRDWLAYASLGSALGLTVGDDLAESLRRAAETYETAKRKL